MSEWDSVWHSGLLIHLCTWEDLHACNNNHNRSACTDSKEVDTKRRQRVLAKYRSCRTEVGMFANIYSSKWGHLHRARSHDVECLKISSLVSHRKAPFLFIKTRSSEPTTDIHLTSSLGADRILFEVLFFVIVADLNLLISRSSCSFAFDRNAFVLGYYKKQSYH